MKKTILVTGGAGYIGSHICVELLQAGFEVVVVDNLSNSSHVALDRIAQITEKTLHFYQIDVCHREPLAEVFRAHEIDMVIHLAGLKAVGESCEQPLRYFQNNLVSSMVLVDVMQQFAVNNLVFSSSATVYGDPASVPIDESFPLSATNPYGRTKLMIEEMLTDITQAPANTLKVVLLRYFNPAGAHHSGLIGEDPNDIPNNLLPYVSQVAVGKLEKVSVFGDDYATEDGTGVRDYIHVVDLAKGHVKALNLLEKTHSEQDCLIYNLGTGRGYSVLEVIDAFKQASGQDIPYQISPRRSGDVAACYADPQLANQELGWQAEKTLVDMVTDAWRWQSMNPQGYASDSNESTDV
ncbi:MAG: UDP-glucose 4-epimerase GalE [Gammaproteobacteria bacterium]|nr:MAG: UDP-glucose 4-epimerase GalE [Gammaproteobacteria bacterium]